MKFSTKDFLSKSDQFVQWHLVTSHAEARRFVFYLYKKYKTFYELKDSQLLHSNQYE